MFVLKEFVSVIVGSESDLDIVIENTTKTLERFGVNYELRVWSAHRAPTELREYVQHAEQRGAKVFIAGAGLAAHLAGAIAAMTLRPVIGIPIGGGPLNGLDSLLSTVQMPGGVPVATVAIGKAGAKNAAYLAAQILAINNLTIFNMLADDRFHMREEMLKKNVVLRDINEPNI